MTREQYEERIRVLNAYGCTPEDLCDEAERVMAAARTYGRGARVAMLGSREYVDEVFRLIPAGVRSGIRVRRSDPLSSWRRDATPFDAGVEEYVPEVG